MPQQFRTWKIDVDIPLLIMLFAVNLTENVLTNFLLYQTCHLILDYNQTECNLLSSNPNDYNITSLEQEVQQAASIFVMARTMVVAIIPACFVLFLGPWSDQHGRKPLIMLPTLGYALSFCACTVLTLFPNASPWYIVATSIPISVFGGVTILISGVFCYINDLVPSNDRAVRIGVLQGVLTIGLLLGQLSSGPLLKATNYTIVFAIGALLNFISVLYTLSFLKESVPIERRLAARQHLLDYRHVYDMFRTCFQRRDASKRMIVWIVLTSLALTMFTMGGKLQIEYLFFRNKLEWDLEMYSIYNSVCSVIVIVGSMLGIYIFNKVFKISESVLGLLSFLSGVIMSIINSIAVKPWQFYAISPAGMLEGMTSPMCRTIISQNVDPDEIGKVFAMVSSMEALAPLLSAPIYTYLYKNTLTIFPGAFYLLTASIKAFCVLLFGIIYCSSRNDIDSELVPVIVNEELNSED